MAGGTLYLAVDGEGTGEMLSPQKIVPGAIYIPVELDVALSVGSQPSDDDVPPGAPEPPPDLVTPRAPQKRVWIRRVNHESVPAPTLDAFGKPTLDWDLGNVLYSWWGRHKIVIGGRDVSMFRSVPTRIVSYSKAEPFGDKTAEIVFPQITAFEPNPSWLKGGASVEINKLAPDGTIEVRWEGLVSASEDALGNEIDGLHVECMGAAYQYDLYVRKPLVTFDDTLVDIGTQLAEQLTPAARDMRAIRCRPLARKSTGVLMRRTGDGGPLLTGWSAEMLSKAWPWTIRKRGGRLLELAQKDTTTEHIHYRVGEQGVAIELRRDITQAPTTIYGEGENADNCRWRNAKYPHLHQDSAPVFAGTIMSPGGTYAQWRIFAQHLHDHGYPQFAIDDTYNSSERSLVERFQAEAGIEVDGDVGPQTWAAAFDPGANIGSFDDAYLAPLSSLPPVEYTLKNSAGADIGANPSFDPTLLRVERWESFGARLEKSEGIRSAQGEIARDHPAAYFGTITLSIDSPQLARWDIREGMNVVLHGHKGVDRRLHIAEVVFEPDKGDEGTATLTVDERARDWMTLAQMLERDRDNTDPARHRQRQYRNQSASRAITDSQPVWDCESGAGIIPRHATYRGLWNVLKIPAGKVGRLVRLVLTAETPALMAAGLFDRPVTAAQLVRIAPNGPLQPMLDADGVDAVFWDTFPDPLDPHDDRRRTNNIDGLLWAMGQTEQPGGLWPYTLEQSKPVTGKIVDNASLDFESQDPPFLYVALMCTTGPTVNYVSGELKPGVAGAG